MFCFVSCNAFSILYGVCLSAFNLPLINPLIRGGCHGSVLAYQVGSVCEVRLVLGGGWQGENMLLIFDVVLGRILAPKMIPNHCCLERLISWGFANAITFARVIKVNDLKMGEILLNYWWVQHNHKDP